MSNDPEQIRREIERTRTELSENVNALGDKVNPGSIAKRQVGRVRCAAASVKDAVLGSASDAADTGQRVAGSIGDTVSDAPTAVARKAQGSPIAAGLIAFGAGLIAFGAGLLVSSMLPASRAEQQAAQAVKDTAQPLVDDLTDTAKEIAGNLQEPAQQALEEVKAIATDSTATVRDEAASAAADVKAKAAESKDTLQQAAR